MSMIDQRLYNKVYIVNYIAGYIYFINVLNSNLLLYISCKNVKYDIVNSLKASKFLIN